MLQWSMLQVVCYTIHENDDGIGNLLRITACCIFTYYCIITVVLFSAPSRLYTQELFQPNPAQTQQSWARKEQGRVTCWR